MGISPVVAEAIVREHAFRKIEGVVLLLGRQTMLFDPETAIDMLKRCGVVPTTEDAASLKIDDQTLASAGHRFIRDDEFFRLLGVDTVRSLDHSDYEGAEIVHDLNVPVPPELEGIADFVLDGSTLDNVFDPACCLRNMARLLRPNGRVLSTNMGTNHYVPYTIPTPSWIMDYFVYNQFKDIRVYFVSYMENGHNVVVPSLRHLNPGVQGIQNLNPPFVSGIIFIAEKGEKSTWDVAPSQHHYRGSDGWGVFSQGLAKIVGSKRPFHFSSTAPCAINVPDGWLFVEKDWIGQPPKY